LSPEKYLRLLDASPSHLKPILIVAYNTGMRNGVTFHDIRRTVKTNMLNSGMDKAHRDMMIGYSQKGMDAHYLVAVEESLKLAMLRYTEWLGKKLAKRLAKSHNEKINNA